MKFAKRNPGKTRTRRLSAERLEKRSLLAADLAPLVDIASFSTGIGGTNLDPQRMIVAGSTMYFTAATETTGVELWKSDGTPQGTVLLKDVRPGVGASNPSNFTVVNDILYFSANDGAHGKELWKTDGTPEGTMLIKDIFEGSTDSYPVFMTNVNGMLYFRAGDLQHGVELWKSDGTASGTALVRDIDPAAFSGSAPSFLTNVNGVLYFNANDGVFGKELWKSDGTLAGTSLVRDILVGPSGSDPGANFTSFTNVNGVLYFTANDGSHGNELWKSDGTTGGTSLVLDIESGPVGSSPSYLTNVGGALYMSAFDTSNGRELWKSNGTAAGTNLIQDIRSGGASSSPFFIRPVGGTTYFLANDGVRGTELWKTDGTSSGTVLVQDILAGSGGSRVSYLTEWNGELYFQANDGSHGVELWKTDGSGLGTVLVADIMPGAPSSSPRGFIAFQGSLFFNANDGSHGPELWQSNGTTAGTQQFLELPTPTSNAFIAGLTNVNGDVFFTALDATHGGELWKSDGTPGGTQIVRDIRSGASGSNLDQLVNVNGRLFFAASGGTEGKELWTSDGTEAGTVLVKDIRSGPSADSSISGMVNVNGSLYFAANDGLNGLELWRSDGTSAGTTMVKDIQGGSAGSYPRSLLNVNGLLFFTAQDGSGEELWKSDGTAGGTTLVKDIFSGAGSSGIQSMVNVGGVLYFRASDGVGGAELWRSDGTSAGTYLVRDIHVGGSDSYPQALVEVGGALFFVATDGVTGLEVWKSDGTSTGTTLVKDIRLGSAMSAPLMLTNVNGTLFFAADDGIHGQGLWKSDGSAAGTMLVRELMSGPNLNTAGQFTNFNGSLYFRANDGIHGYELWKSNGTSEGTVLVLDINGRGSSNPGPFGVTDSKLFFSASTDTYGQELYFLNRAPTSISLTSTSVAEGIPSGTTVGSFSTGDPDVGENFTYSFGVGLGDSDNGRFVLSGNQLKTAGILDFETASAYSIRVRSTDGTGNMLEQVFTIHVSDVNEAPTLSLVNVVTSLVENTSTAVPIRLADILVQDDALGVEALSLSGSQLASFELSGNQLFLRAGVVLDYEVLSQLQVVVQVDDAELGVGVDDSEVYTLQIQNVAEVPSDLQLSNASVSENLGSGVVIGTLTTTDTPDSTSFDYALVSGEGDTNNSQFQIVGDQLLTAEGFDFESMASRTIRIRTTNAANLGYEESLAISILDQPEGTSSNEVFVLAYSGTAPTGSVAITRVVGSAPPVNLGVFPMSRGVTVYGMGGTDTVKVVGTAGDDLFDWASSGLWINGAALSTNETESLMVVGGAGNDQYRFDVDIPIGTVFLDEGLGGNDTLDFSLSDMGVSVNLSLANTQLLNGNLSLNLKSASAFENLVGGAGNDVLTGNSLANSLWGGAGDDSLQGGNGLDTLVGEEGNDTLNGGASNDVYSFAADGELGMDIILDSSGLDTLSFSETTQGVSVDLSVSGLQSVNTHLHLNLGTAAIENVVGGSGGDHLVGNSLANSLTGGGGDDSLAGGPGNDTYLFNTASALGSDVLIDSVGIDTLSYAGSPTSVVVNLGVSGAQTVSVGSAITLSGVFDNLIGGAGNDVLSGNVGNNVLSGGMGDDQLQGGMGNDTYPFDADFANGSDTLEDIGGVDVLDFSTTTLPVQIDLSRADLQVVSGFLQLTLVSPLAFENVKGGAGDDILSGNPSNNALTGGLGNDAILGRDGNDTLTGGAGDDTLVGGGQNDTYVFDSDVALGRDTLDESGGGIDTLDFGATSSRGIELMLKTTGWQIVNTNLELQLMSDDTIENVRGTSQADGIVGNALANTLFGGAGNDSLNGWDGDDVLVGEGGDDDLRGFRGNDRYQFDTDLAAGLGRDILADFSGVDTLDFSLTTTMGVTLDLGLSGLQIVNSKLSLILQTPVDFENAFGTSQNDVLHGNGAGNVLVGNAGNDRLEGGTSNSILVGGLGVDQLIGSNGEDILIAGRTVSDGSTIQWNQLRDEWMSTGSLNTRVTNMRAGVGSPPVSLKAKVTVLKDTATIDELTGRLGDDWFFRSVDDAITDLTAGDLIDLL